MEKQCKIILLDSDKPSTILYCNNDYLQYDENAGKNYVKSAISYKNLFVLSDDEIKEGDWYLYKENFLDGAVKTQKDYNNGKWLLSKATKNDIPYIQRAENGKNNQNNLRGIGKIIATTNSELWGTKSGSVKVENLTSGMTRTSWQPNTPKISLDFVRAYIKAYNKGEQIKKVMVDYTHYNMISEANIRTGNYNFTCPNCNDEQYDVMYSSLETPCFKCSKLKVSSNGTISITPVEEKKYTREEVLNILDKFSQEMDENYPNLDIYVQGKYKDWFNKNY